ncbi:putative disease resistance RPP13-like protein 3 [Brachypodium distachyon]|uniref:Uncharacterized protein n=1 Tax=Brachypodium distachyon TaxID=15368 RepID=I1IJ80_BRADI|nr:putative disease resistance RPP13-like protein 3 [Brachypodium distachyon]XP_010237385.1 putative disease resistance RPP13-like protein 3 [Brachypodium distachyon]KQJ87180.1 hypothetical protein BRADI_4g09587v3 [Brachypodium distachyon]KQJ87181.1 hypothetical protein BRADI_4g09587v3 [Brachypodium distachyon]|eukprot:XP_003575644.1 putative disease resistance RPP13-like protein 3 [Brachypodium distachyon]
MELATGAMGSLLPKLSELITEEYKLQKGVKKQIKFLMLELEAMLAALLKIADVPRDQLDEQTKIWADEVRDLSYTMEDVVDRFMLPTKGSAPPTNPDSFNEIMRKMFKSGNTRHRISVAIRDIKDQVQEVSQRHAMLDVPVANSVAAVTVDPRLVALYEDERDPVGLQEPSDEIIKMLLGDGGDGVYTQQLKILSIVGFGGMGKTTLAKLVYDRISKQFDCRAFVSVGRVHQVKSVFKAILLQIDEEKYTDFDSAALDEVQCIYQLRELLQNKRYFIVIDDVWDIQSWEIIRCALTDTDLGSIVITTTRIFRVAEIAGDVYQLLPLSDRHSEELFYTRLFGGKVKPPDDQTTDLIQKFLQKCGGVPLAITTISSLLSGKPKDDWHKVYSSIGLRLSDDTTVDSIRPIILLSYQDLPHRLRVCLLHLSIYPEDYIVRKDTLIWKWVTEGFVREEPGVGLFELGEQYLNELINRSMVQPLENPHSGVIIGCRVHDLVLDMICSMAAEENFVTVLDDNKQRTSSRIKGRRLALQKKVIDGQDHLDNTLMSHMRSFNAIGCHTSVLPSLSSFKVLRVLAIEDSIFLEGNSYHLKHIGVLCHLRYLGLWRTPIHELPEEIGNLQFLQMLDLRQTGIRDLPSSVNRLRNLRCLRADSGSARVPDGMGKLISLEELQLGDVSSSPNFVKELGKLTELRELRIWIQVLDERSKKALVESLSNMQKIQVLHLDGGLWIEDAEWEGYVPPRQLRHLSLRIKSSRLPRWINHSLLPNLSHLSVEVMVLEANDLVILGMFPQLLTLKLFVPNISLDIRGAGAFPKLRHCYASGMLRFLQGAAPRLESVNFNVLLWDLKGANFEFGSLGNLPMLQKVRVEIFYSDAHGATEVKEAEAALRHAVDLHPNSPHLDISKYKSSFDELNAENEEEEEEDDDE